MKSVLGLSTLGLALSGLLLGAPARAEVVDSEEPPRDATAASAQKKADHYEDLAEHYRGFGGMAYKAGLVEQAQREAAHYQAIADNPSGSPTSAASTKEAASPLPSFCESMKPAIQTLDCKK